ncbi:MAG: HEAT repeat domain-containing protein [Myxococcales bacterium]
MTRAHLPTLLTTLVLGVLSPPQALAQEGQLPAAGDWSGFGPGAYAVHKHTSRSGESDQVRYVKSVLLGFMRSGEPSVCQFSARAPAGPWAPIGYEQSYTPSDSQREDVEVACEQVAVGLQTLPCTVTRTVITNDWGTRTRTDAVSNDLGLVVRRQEAYEGRDGEGWLQRRTTRWVTTGVETVTIAGEHLACLAQAQEAPDFGTWELRWLRLVNASIPGHVVFERRGEPPGEATAFLSELVAWGVDLDLAAKHPPLRDPPDRMEEARREFREEAEKMRRDSEELHRRLLADLRSPDEDKREWVLRNLGDWRGRADSADVDAVVRSLDDRSPLVRRAADRAAGELGIRGQSAKILQLLAGDADGAASYLRGLGRLGDAESLPAIRRHSSSKVVAARIAAVAALGNYRTGEARRTLEAALQDSNLEVRWEAEEALEKVGDASSVPALLPLLSSRSGLDSERAFRTIAVIGDDSAVPHLLPHLRAPDPAFDGLRLLYLSRMKLKDTRAVSDALLDALGDSSPEYRVSAILALGELREKRAVPRLMELVRGERPLARSAQGWFFGLEQADASVLALGMVGGEEAEALLSPMLDSPEKHQLACKALTGMGVQGADIVMRHLRRSFDRWHHSAFEEELDVLAGAGDEMTARDLEAYLPDCPPFQKKTVRKTIAAIRERELSRSHRAPPARGRPVVLRRRVKHRGSPSATGPHAIGSWPAAQLRSSRPPGSRPSRSD